VIAHADFISNGVVYHIAYGVKVVVLPQEQKISDGAKIAMWVCAGLTAAFLLVVLAGLLIYRDHKVIHVSTNIFSYLFILCGLLCLVTVVVMGLTPSRVICSLRLWFLAPTSLFVFLLLSAKSWRVHRIFTNPSLTSTAIGDIPLLGGVCAITSLIVILLIVWTASFTPRARTVQSFDDVRTICDGPSYMGFAVTVIIFNSLAVLLALVFSFITRNILTLFDESRWIFMTVLCCVVVAAIVVPVQFIVDTETAAFIVRSLGVVACVFLSVVLLFGPKFLLVFGKKKNEFQVFDDRSRGVGTNSTAGNTTESVHKTENSGDADWDDDAVKSGPSNKALGANLAQKRLVDDLVPVLDDALEKTKEVLRKHRTGLAIHKEDLALVAKAAHALDQRLYSGTQPPNSGNPGGPGVEMKKI